MSRRFLNVFGRAPVGWDPRVPPYGERGQMRPPLRKGLPLPLGEVARRRRDGEGFLLPSQAEITDFGQLPQRGSQGTVQDCTAPRSSLFT